MSKSYTIAARGMGGQTRVIKAVADLNLSVRRGEIMGLVGESGSGKSTVANLMMAATRPDPGGEVTFCARDCAVQNVADLGGPDLMAFRRKVQMVFQDPFSSLSPRMTVRDILTEPLKIHGVGERRDMRDKAAELMRCVGLSPDHLSRFPHAFSGGQRQRICIARALALGPEMILCDEPTSALDVSVQAQVLDLLLQVKEDLGLSYLFISHDLAVVAKLVDRVAVMRRGRIVEEGSAADLFANPRHPYTKALIAASPEPHLNRKLDLTAVARGAGEPDSWPEPFGYSGDDAPALVEEAPGHFVRRAA